MLSRYFLLFLTLNLSCTLSIAQSDASLPPNAEAGKCYTKCLIADGLVDNIESQEVTYPIYIGTDPNAKTKDLTFIIQPKKDFW